MDRQPTARDMRRYWDERARENAAYYVDTTCDYDVPDMSRFFETGREIVQAALFDGPFAPNARARRRDRTRPRARVQGALPPLRTGRRPRRLGRDGRARASSSTSRMSVSRSVTGLHSPPIGDGTADLVVTFTVLQHLTSRDAVLGYLREAARVLRSGGVLSAQWNGDAHPRRYRMRARWWKVRQRFFRRDTPDNRLAPEFLGTPVSAADVLQELETSGLKVVGTKDVGTLFSWVWATKP